MYCDTIKAYKLGDAMKAYTIRKQDGDFIVVNAKGLIIAYCESMHMASDVMTAQTLDDERHRVMDAYNKGEHSRVLMAEFNEEFVIGV